MPYVDDMEDSGKPQAYEELELMATCGEHACEGDIEEYVSVAPWLYERPTTLH